MRTQIPAEEGLRDNLRMDIKANWEARGYSRADFEPTAFLNEIRGLNVQIADYHDHLGPLLFYYPQDVDLMVELANLTDLRSLFYTSLSTARDFEDTLKATTYMFQCLWAFSKALLFRGTSKLNREFLRHYHQDADISMIRNLVDYDEDWSDEMMAKMDKYVGIDKQLRAYTDYKPSLPMIYSVELLDEMKRLLEQAKQTGDLALVDRIEWISEKPALIGKDVRNDWMRDYDQISEIVIEAKQLVMDRLPTPAKRRTDLGEL